MGVWGAGIFSDDTAADVRDEYRGHLADGFDGPVSTDKVLKSFGSAIDDIDLGSPFWLGLAATQASCGRLEDRVRDRALKIIADGSDLKRFAAQPRVLAARRRVLQRLERQLLGPPREPVRVRREVPIVCEWAAGEVVGFVGDSGKRLIYVQAVVGDKDRFPLVSILDLAFDRAETANDQTPYLTVTGNHARYKDCFYLLLTKREYRSKHFVRTGVTVSPTMSVERPETLVSYVAGKSLESFLSSALQGRPLG